MARRTRIERGSKEFLHIPVSSPDGTPLSDLSVFVALVPSGKAVTETDFRSGLWAQDGTTALVLLGPGGTFDLTPGTYVVFVKISDSPEVPILRAGTITVV